MSNLRRRLEKLQARLTDSTGLVPHSKEWSEYWEERIDRLISGADPGEPGCIPIEVLDAVPASLRSDESP